jgi:hypothetical protein
MDLYKLQKISTSNSKLSYNKPGISKNFHRLSLVRLPYVFNKTSAVRCLEMSAVRVSEISAALSAVGVNKIYNILKVSVLSSKCLFWFFPRSTDFSGLSLLLSGLKSNGFRPDPLAGPRSCQRAPRWIQRCTRFWWLTCHFGERT